MDKIDRMHHCCSTSLSTKHTSD